MHVGFFVLKNEAKLNPPYLELFTYEQWFEKHWGGGPRRIQQVDPNQILICFFEKDNIDLGKAYDEIYQTFDNDFNSAYKASQSMLDVEMLVLYEGILYFSPRWILNAYFDRIT